MHSVLSMYMQNNKKNQRNLIIYADNMGKEMFGNKSSNGLYYNCKKQSQLFLKALSHSASNKKYHHCLIIVVTFGYKFQGQNMCFYQTIHHEQSQVFFK